MYVMIYTQSKHQHDECPTKPLRIALSGALEEEERVGLHTFRGVQDGGEEVGRDDVGNTTDLAVCQKPWNPLFCSHQVIAGIYGCE